MKTKQRSFSGKHRSTTFLLFALIWGFIFTSCSRKAYSVLELNIENKKYEQLSLFAIIRLPDGYYRNGWETHGKSTDGHKWRFVVPDSINKRADYGYNIRTKPFDFEKNEGYELNYSANKFSDKKVRNIFLTNKVTGIKGNYTHTYKDDIGDLAYVLVDTLAMGVKINSDVINLEIGKACQSELEIQLSYPYFDKPDSYTLDERLKTIQSYPHSMYLLNTLPDLTKSLDKKELGILFNAFSDGVRHSKDGQAISDYISVEIHPASIDTLNLANSKNGNLEPIIKDRSKYTLVIFSASWCGPCHEQIPLLKEVFNHCGNKLDMVYISSDQENGEGAWNKMTERYEIPWRSLFARDYKKGLYKQYGIDGIPYSLLVYPNGANGKVEEIDIRHKADKEKLYKLLE